MSRPRLHDLLSNLFESKDAKILGLLLNHEDFSDFADTHSLQVNVSDLSEAFTHTSFSHEFNSPHQEQLEFLGDSVLQLILTDEIVKRMPGSNEGHLSKLRSAIVNEKSLSTIARGLGLQNLILVGKGEFKKKLFELDPVLADSFEALLAQVYRTHGLEFTKTLFLGWLDKFIPSAFEADFLNHFDAKSKLQEKVLAKYKKVPRYSSEASGDRFEITLWINDLAVAKGLFTSKKIGEKELAQSILEKDHF